MKDIVRTCFSCHEGMLTDLVVIVFVKRSGKMGPVPGDSLFVVEVEEMDLLGRGGKNVRMLREIVIKRRCPAPLGADDDKVGHQPEPAR